LVRQRLADKRLFSEIEGYDDIRRLIMKCILSPEPIHVILDGPPASGKTIFLLSMQKGLYNSYFVDCTNATGPGMIDYLFKHDVKYLLLDEVEKMSKSDQNVLLNVLETGVLTSTKVRKTASKKMNLSVFATTNDIDAISKPFRSRFIELSLPSYTYEEFCNIAIELLGNRYEHTEEVSVKIADTVWNKIKSKDVRDILSIGKLSKTVDDVEFVAATLKKYMRRSNEE
jgi:replication-associated recombination protein RarA